MTTTKTYSTKSNAKRAALAAGLLDGQFDITGTKGAFGFEARMVILATEDEDLGHLNARDAEAEAVKLAAELGKPVSIRNATTDEVLKVVEPPKPTKPKKAAKEKAAPAAPKAEGPSGMVAKIIELATRPEGVTPAELNEMTKWKGAPWKWLFQNPKGTGYADRWGYSLEVVKQGRAATYRLTTSA